jgi:hypothetical protein
MKRIRRWFGSLLCKIGWHAVPNRHYLSPSAWSGPCTRRGCGVIVTTPQYVEMKEALSRPDELCPHNCSGRACGYKPTGEAK